MHPLLKKTSAVLLGIVLTEGLPATQAGPAMVLTGKASWYSRKSPGISKYTASGERFDERKKTCATYHYPLGTKLKVTNLESGKSVVCRVNDRGPARRLGRKIDLTRAAFREIGELKHGIIRVKLQPVESEN